MELELTGTEILLSGVTTETQKVYLRGGAPLTGEPVDVFDDSTVEMEVLEWEPEEGEGLEMERLEWDPRTGKGTWRAFFFVSKSDGLVVGKDNFIEVKAYMVDELEETSEWEADFSQHNWCQGSAQGTPPLHGEDQRNHMVRVGYRNEFELGQGHGNWFHLRGENTKTRCIQVEQSDSELEGFEELTA